jgi:O-antigen/teichoic acid export membrane protein
MLKSDYDFWIISAFAKENELAYYAPIIKTAVLIMVPLSIFESLMPKNISFYFNENKRTLLEKYIRTTNTYMFYSSLIFVLIIFFFSKDILLILFGAKFIHLNILLKCVAISFLPKIFFGPCGQILLFTNYEKINLIVNLIFLILSVIIGIILTTNYGYYGMVVTYIIGLIGINLTFYIIVINKVKINPLPYFNIFKAIKK